MWEEETSHGDKMNEEELKKGCGKRLALIDYLKEICNEEHLCPTCQARLEGYTLAKKEEREKYSQALSKALKFQRTQALAEVKEKAKGIEFEYLLQPGRKWTFEQPKLKLYIEKWCRGKVLNLFAGKIKLNADEFRVDSSDEFKPDWLGDAMEFIKTTDMKFDTIILDPPYSLRKSYEKYKGHYIGSKWTQVKRALMKVCNPNCRVISLGYNSQGMSKINGFKKIAILLICHNGDINDTLVTIEELLSQIDDNSQEQGLNKRSNIPPSNKKSMYVDNPTLDTKEKPLCRNCGYHEDLHPIYISGKEVQKDGEIFIKWICEKYEEAQAKEEEVNVGR